MVRISIPGGYQDNPAGWAHATLAPDISRAFNELSVQVYKNALVPLRVFEAARARIALINGCLKCIAWRSVRDVPGYLERYGEEGGSSLTTPGADEPDEEFYENLEQWRSSPIYSEQERLAIELAENFALHPQGLDSDEEFWARAKDAFADAELFSLMMSIGSFVAGGRLMHMLEFDSHTCAIVPLAVSRAESC